MFLGKRYFKIFIVLLVVGVLYYVLPLFVSPTIIETTESDIYTPPESLPSILTELNNLFANNGEDYWYNWEYENKIAEFVVSGIDKDNGLFRVFVLNPSGLPFSGKTTMLSLNCAAQETYAVSTDNPTKVVTSDFH